VTALKGRGWQVLGSDETGNPSGSAWTEAGALDKRGHNEGWKLARSVETEVRDLASRIVALLKAGWSDVVVVTDHGWLLIPGGLPKVELKSFLTEYRWGRCAALKSQAQTSALAFKWRWNPEVTIASPQGVGCFRASMEYSHGGVSLQEMVIPVLHVKAPTLAGGSARLLDSKWTGARCRVSVGGDCVGVRVDVALCSSLLQKSIKGGLAVTGGLNLGGSIETIFNPVAVVEVAIEKGAASILMPISSRRQLNDLPDDLAAKITVHYYIDARDALLKALAI
jgi:predicted ATP-dependent Lon-type protease